MKKIFLIALALTSMGLNAQYFQSLYGSTQSFEFLSDGQNVYNAGGPEHLLAGPGEFIFGGRSAINIQKADVNGSTTAPGTFNNHYTVSDIGGAFPALNPNLVTQNIHTVEMSDGSGYAIAGAYTRGATGVGFGAYFYMIDQMGNTQPGPNYFGWYPNGNYIGIRVQALIESKKNPGNFYICGYVIEAGTRYNKVFVIKVDRNGTIAWDHIYELDYNNPNDSDIPYDMIESPYLHPVHGLDEFWIVGSHTDQSVAGANTDGFILRIDDIYGNMLNPNTFYGTQASNDVFTSIIPTANTNVDLSGNGEGFVIAGYTDESGNNDAWNIAMDNNQSVAWANKFNYMVAGAPTLNNDVCNHLMERINTMGVEEYYLVGTTDNGVHGTEDVLVFKLDNNGNLTPNGQFTYGDVDADRGIRIDQLNGFGPDADGIAIYAQSFHIPQIGGFDHYLIKAYFNGVTSCKDDQQDGDQQPGPNYLFDTNSDNTGPNNFTDFPMQIDVYQPLSELLICSSPSESDGNNARIAPTEPKGDKEAKVSPNPIAQGVQYANVEIDIEQPTTAQVSVYDMLGRAYYSQTFTLVKGKNNLVLDISDINMAQGMYTVKVQGDNLNQNIVWLMK